MTWVVHTAKITTGSNRTSSTPWKSEEWTKKIPKPKGYMGWRRPKKHTMPMPESMMRQMKCFGTIQGFHG